VNARAWNRAAGTAVIAVAAVASAAFAGNAAADPPIRNDASPVKQSPIAPPAAAQTLTAVLRGESSNVRGLAKYGPTVDGALRLAVEVRNARSLAGEELQVTVAGLPVGSMQVGPDGRAALLWPKKGDASIGIYFPAGSLVEVKRTSPVNDASVVVASGRLG
jgi:hypothetical protein